MTAPYAARQFAALRVLTGLYLLICFLQVLPYAAELYSREGILPEAALNATAAWFPNVLAVADAPAQVMGCVAGLALLAALLAAGVARPVVAALLWYGWACLVNRNLLTLNPSLPYVGWLLLAMVVAPPGEGWSVRGRRSTAWSLPAGLWWGGWTLLGVGYTISGFVKLMSPSWITGEAVRFVLESPIARLGPIRNAVLSWPPSVLAGLTWGVLAAELLAGPLVLFARTRAAAWALMVSVHIGILLTVDLTYITLGMLLAHAFVFDPAWLLRRARFAQP